ncbi:GGDEF domain-containing protein [Hahella sp. CCB-MM4]|uniref:bifunctional diguanylate cyclase/phosphodiesterase n=1 Tax=Hahella sp. (strain CCB-MM4) TaxID=1926491 RepID=UPI000B9BDA11|nr:EAL domain-containing protein [Hahella sp. CCB-MM4]OZG71184.1 GGDEF domain-containing protein [Hahella sp. CCB-MM4]
MGVNRLGSQILLLTTLLVCAVSMTVLITVWISTATYTQRQVSQDINRAVKVFNQLLNERQNQLIASAEVLTSDFGFKQAVASNDRGTIESVLENHGARIDADLMLLIGLDGEMKAAYGESGITPGTYFEPRQMLEDALTNGGAASFVVNNKQLYQIILLPVRAPVPVALTGIGFRLDLDLAQQLLQLSSLNVSFVDMSAGHRNVLVSTLNESVRDEALMASDAVDMTFRLPFLKHQSFTSKHQPITSYEGHRIEAVLTVNLERAYEDFDRLRDTIFVITLSTLILAIFGSAFLSRNLAGPLADLERVARDIARGDYHNLPTINSRTREIKALFRAFVSMRNDIKQREQRISYQATHDHLTGLFNRTSLMEQVNANIRSGHASFVIASININGFRNVNDTFGPQVGDRCLCAVGERLTQLVADNPLTARSGADEFFLVLPVPPGASPFVLGPQILEQLCVPLEFENLRVSLSFSVGISSYPNDGDTAEKLVRRAGIALDKARSSRKELCYYQEGEEEAHLDRLALLDDLKMALKNDDGQLCMYYQPKQNLKTGQIDKCEALIRWIHPTRRFVSPELFVGLAEQSGLIDQLTDWVITSVIQQSAQWRQKGIHIQIAINISAQDLEREELLTNVCRQLEKYALTPDCLSFELTERDMMSDADKAVLLMERFTRHGFHLSVDDYGIGHSSLSKLKQMPVRELKIDKSFVLQLEQSESDQIIVQSTIDLGHSFQLKVIAEGVETETALTLLKHMGCDYIQGYHLARPMPPEDFQLWLDQQVSLSESRPTA